MTLFDFMGEHPVLTVILVLIILLFLEGVVANICNVIRNRNKHG